MADHNYLDDLNEQQRAAVEYGDGPALVIAGAGSGKTRVLTYKIVHLLNQGLNPYRIMALTFTNKAAREMKERIAALIGDDEASRLWMGTFHSIFLRLLRYNSDRIGFRHECSSDLPRLHHLRCRRLPLAHQDHRQGYAARRQGI